MKTEEKYIISKASLVELIACNKEVTAYRVDNGQLTSCVLYDLKKLAKSDDNYIEAVCMGRKLLIFLV